MIHKRFLCVNFNGDMRIAKRRPKGDATEVIYEVVVDIPDAWTEPIGTINLAMPDPPDVLQDTVQLAKELRK